MCVCVVVGRLLFIRDFQIRFPCWEVARTYSKLFCRECIHLCLHFATQANHVCAYAWHCTLSINMDKMLSLSVSVCRMHCVCVLYVYVRVNRILYTSAGESWWRWWIKKHWCVLTIQFMFIEWCIVLYVCHSYRFFMYMFENYR